MHGINLCIHAFLKFLVISAGRFRLLQVFAYFFLQAVYDTLFLQQLRHNRFLVFLPFAHLPADIFGLLHPHAFLYILCYRQIFHVID